LFLAQHSMAGIALRTAGTAYGREKRALAR
jgi:hypothetical protein